MDKIIDNEPQEKEDIKPTPRRLWAWLNILVTVILLAAGVWYLITHISLSELGLALRSANLWFILLSLGSVLVTLLLKAWRWQLMFPNKAATHTFPTFYWALLLGAYINVLVPFLRLGELARIVALDRLTHIQKAQSLATLLLEKTLDMIMLGLTLGIVLTAVALPDYLHDTFSTLIISLIAFSILLLLYAVAVNNERVMPALNALFNRLPVTVGRRFSRWAAAGLQGLSALQDKQLALQLVGLSLVIAIISVLTPLLLLSAFHIPLGWVEAAFIHIAVSIALVPASTPGKIGIFDGVVAFLLLQFGLQNEAVIAGYTIVYHVIVILPLILLGSVAASRTNASLRQDLL